MIHDLSGIYFSKRSGYSEVKVGASTFAFIVGLIASVPGYAQGTATNPDIASDGLQVSASGGDSTAADNGRIGEIIVTARRREESLQDTPIAISAVSGADLTARGIDTVTDIGDFTPNVRFNAASGISASNATAAIFIRGIGQNDFQLTADPGVGLYLDGVYLSRGVGNVLDVLDIERIEVLRGPQGTLFGRNTIGGAVSVVTRKPSDVLTGKVEATTGSFSRIQLKGSLDIPLADGVYTSFAAFYHNRDGYVEGVGPGAPDLGDTNTLAGRFALRLEPTDRLSVDISLDGTRSREESAPNVAIEINENAQQTQAYNALFSGAPQICLDQSSAARLSDPRCYNNQYALAPYESAATFDAVFPNFIETAQRPFQSASDMDLWGISGTVEWEAADNFSLKSITAYRSVEGFWGRDADYSPLPLVQNVNIWSNEQFSQELQLLGDLVDGRLNWVVGGYFADESGAHNDLVGLNDAIVQSGAVMEAESLAFFGQASFEVIPDLDFTAGLRWTEDKKTFFDDNQQLVRAGFLAGAPLNPDGSPLADGNPLVGEQERSIEASAWTPMVSLAYRWNPDFMTYVSYSEGFKGGGFTQRIFPPLSFIPSFGPETSESYEFGFKADLFDRRARLNGAIFRNDYSDLQVTVQDAILGVAPIIRNAAKSRIEGFELEFDAQPVRGLTLSAGVGYLDARYTDVNLISGTASVTLDDALQNAPDWTLSGSAAYDIDLSGVGTLTPRVDWSYRSEIANDAANTPQLIQEGYHLLNASIGLLTTDDRILLRAEVRNITDEVYLVAGYNDEFGGVIQGLYGRPREWAISASFEF